MFPVVFSHAALGWLTLLGLAVPVAIYLWNRRPGRVVRVGSVRWLQAAANRRLRSLRPEQLGLLLLRAAIIGLLALAVAEPARLLPVPPARGQVLLAPGLTPAALAPLRSALDSLRQRGYQLRQLHTQRALAGVLPWASLGLGDTTAAPPFQPDTLPAPNLWQLVRAAADSVPDRALVVVAPLTLAGFQGTRPALPATVRWLPVPTPDSTQTVVSAWQPRPDSLVLLLATAQETGTTYRLVRRRWPAGGGRVPVPGAVVRAEARPAAVYQGSRRLPLLTRPAHWHLSADAAHAGSARVLRAALRAVAGTLPLAPRLTEGPTLPADSLDWLFWLRDAPLPAGRLARTRVWQEARTGIRQLTAFQPTSAAPPLAVLQLDTSRQRGSQPLWLTAGGQPLLTTPAAGRYYLHTRLTPDWSELADSPTLPALLLPLLHPAPPALPDARLLPPAQLATPPLAAAPPLAATAPRRALAPWLVLAAGLLFVAERLWAARRVSVSPSTAAA